MRRTILILCLASGGCGFAKDPYLFPNLAGRDASAPDAAAAPDAAEDAASDAHATVVDAGLDAGFNADAAEPPTAAGNAVLLSGGSDSLFGAGASGRLPAGGAARTVEAWVRGAGASSGRLLNYGLPGVGANFTFILAGRPGQWGGLAFFDGASFARTATLAALGDPDWHHVALVMSATMAPDGHSALTFYLDGVEVGSGEKVGSDPTDAEVSPVAVDRFDRLLLDELRVWSVARTQAQLQSAMRTPPLDDTPGLVARWSMDVDGAGPGVVIPNSASRSATVAPSLRTVGEASFVRSEAF